MPVLAGFIEFDNRRSASQACEPMLAALVRFGRDGCSSDQLGEASFGCQHHHSVPEDDYDRQPYQCAGGRFLLSADARVDNRSEIGEGLGLSPGDIRYLSDAELVARGWERWELGLFDRLLGDVALAVWDKDERELTLARTPLATRPLYFHQASNHLAFGSLPSALFAIPSASREPNYEQFALLMAGGLYVPQGKIPFRNIESVPHGHAVRLGRGRHRTVRLWSLGTNRRDIGIAEAGEAIRAELDRAVRAQLRRRSGPVACHLSSGRDSNAVAASAAMIEREFGGTVIALTAAPRTGFSFTDPHWIADESEIAAVVARRYGMTHLVCRPGTEKLVPLLDDVTHFDEQPFVNTANLPWMAQINRAAAANGASMMLNGACGNFGLSVGGIGFLGDYRRELGTTQWWRLARNFHDSTRFGWKPILSSSYGEFLPDWVYKAFRSMSGRTGKDHMRLPLLRSPFRERAEEIRRQQINTTRPRSDHRQWLGEILMGIEAEDKYSLANYGLDQRDPTADRRLIELCHSLPVNGLVGATEARPAYAAAFGDRLPLELVGVRRGYQAADWFETISPVEVRAAFERYGVHPLVQEFFDLTAIEAAINGWPSRGGYSDLTYERCDQLLRALALASFMNSQFSI
jgi:asparagine synthase (glutamine-hydrolysing)